MCSAKAASFTDTALTFIDEDGFPFSIPVKCTVDSDGKLVKVAKTENMPSLEGRDVALIFNHITALPRGGYTDRRYIVFWARPGEEDGNLVLKPTKGFTWNEKEVPFFQYSEMKNIRVIGTVDGSDGG